MLDFSHGISELFCDSLTLESFNGVRMSSSWHDNKSNYCDIAACLFEPEVETCSRKKTYELKTSAVALLTNVLRIQ